MSRAVALEAIAPVEPPARLTYQIHIPLPSSGFWAAAGEAASASRVSALAIARHDPRTRSLRPANTAPVTGTPTGGAKLRHEQGKTGGVLKPVGAPLESP